MEGRITIDGFTLEILEVRDRHLIGNCSGCGLVTPTTQRKLESSSDNFDLKKWFKAHLGDFRSTHEHR